MNRQASCHCGQLVLRCDGDPRKISLCHCDDCQRRTGSLFSVCAFFPRPAVTIERGEAKTYRRASASGFDVAFHFCSACGTTLWWEPDRMPDMIGVAVGGFADPDFPMPEQAVWDAHRHRWLEIPGTMAVHERNPVRHSSDS